MSQELENTPVNEPLPYEVEIWNAVYDTLCQKIDRSVTMNLWFNDLVLKKMVDNRVYLQTANIYKKKVLDTRFMDKITEAFTEVCGFEIKPYIIAIEYRTFDDQYQELLEKEAKEQLIAEEIKKGRFQAPDYSAPEPVKDPELIEPRAYNGEFKLTNPNLNFPKVYNPESDKLEDVSLINYLEEMGNRDGMLIMSGSVPEYRPTYTFDNFVVGDSNRMAFSTCHSVAKYPASQWNPLFLYGPPGIGKTHLLYAIANHIEKTRPSFKILYCTSEDFTNDLMAAITSKTTAEFRERYRTADILMIDDIQFIGGKEATQLEFFHTFNTLYESNKQIIVTSDRPPKDIAVLEKRIRSRFESGAIIDIQTPELELRMAIISRKAADMKITIPIPAIQFIAENVTENVRQIEGIIKHLSIYSTLRKEEITEELVRSIVGTVVTAPVSISPDKIISAVSAVTEVSREGILGSSHKKDFTMARHLACYMLRKHTEMTLIQIGQLIGRHYSTVHDSVRYIEREKETDSSIKEFIRLIMKEISSSERK